MNAILKRLKAARGKKKKKQVHVRVFVPGPGVVELAAAGLLS